MVQALPSVGLSSDWMAFTVQILRMGGRIKNLLDLTGTICFGKYTTFISDP